MRCELLWCWLTLTAAWPLHAAPEPPADSLYHLRAELLTESGARLPFDVDRGHPTLISMFYGSCPAACPMLITSLQVYERQLPPAARAHVRVLLVSLDQARDTPQRLGELAREHRADPGRWTFSSASPADARKIASLLGIQYRQLPDGGFDHSLLITLLDEEGRILTSTTRLVGDTQFEARLQAAARAARGGAKLPERRTNP